jgi:hypothetical protein
VFFAHNGFKADFPLIQKILLNDRRFTLKNMCQTGMQVINNEFEVCDKQLIFADSLTMHKMSLQKLCETMNVPVQKQECDHDAINVQNYRSEIKRQNIAEYLKADCKGLL